MEYLTPIKNKNIVQKQAGLQIKKMNMFLILLSNKFHEN